jgi:hypothetical protein
MTDNKYTIILDEDNKDGIKIENVGDSNEEITKSTFFHEEYTKAWSIVEEITEYYTRINNGNGGEKKEKLVKNNIILFSGSRGTGKTSAMASFGKYLEDYKKTKDRFEVLEMIDPSYFQKNKNILLSVITLLFKNVKKTIHKNQKSQPYSANLLKIFERVFNSLKKMEESIPEESTLEYLNQLSDSLDLKEAIKELIQAYLEFIEGDSNYLVLMIDDLDLNVSHATIMMEQIRKYLIHEKLIVLISSNINQLQIELKEHYSKYFAKTLNSGYAEKSTVSVDVEDMATKYLLKLFPPLQRIHIGNSADKFIRTNIKYRKGNNNETINTTCQREHCRLSSYDNSETTKGNKEEKKDLQKYILSLIWKKTRLIFIPEKGMLHPIIPTNMRAFCQFVYMLLELEEVEYPKQDDKTIFINKCEYVKIKNNFEKFKDYILNVWIPSNVSFEEQQIFNNIPKEIERINKHLIQSINMIGEKYKKKIRLKDFALEHNDELKKRLSDRDVYTFVSVNDPRYAMANKISDIYNYPSNNSMGDILLMVDKYKIYFESISDNNFIEAVKIYYSMLLFETMFFNDNDIKTLKSNMMTWQNETPKILNIQKLIGGTLYFPHYFNIIKNKRYEKIISLIKDVVKEIEKDNSVDIDKDKDKDKDKDRDRDKDKDKDKIDQIIKDVCKKRNAQETESNTIERVFADDDCRRRYCYKGKSDDVEEHLFYHEYSQEEKDVDINDVFFILYYGKSRPNRSSSEHIYDTKKIEGKKEVRFDILSLPVNILNIYHTIDRCKIKTDKSAVQRNMLKWSKIESDDYFAPNFLLPIYSVDLMLNYLKKSVEYDDLLQKPSSTKDESEQKSEIKDIENKMRDIGNITEYYNKLNNLTNEKLSEIDNVEKSTEDNKEIASISNVYSNIYQAGAEVFLDSSKLQKKKTNRKSNATPQTSI